jgi:stage II sporulation protein D
VGASGILVAGSKDWELQRLDGKRIAREAGGARLLLRRRGAGPVEVLEEGAKQALWFGGPGDTLRVTAREGGFVGWSGHWYRGTFRVFASQPEGVTLVNEVGLESYLRSVLPNEIGTPRDGGYEAVKAQAVAARSYTLGYLGRRADLGFDLWATVEDQVYAGTTLENDLSDRALDETRGEVLLCDGVPIRALYSSACGGRTANVEDVWPWGWTPYLRSVRDADGAGAAPWCAASSSFRWREEWPVEGFLAMLRQYGGGGAGDSAALNGALLDVRVRSRSRCGRVQDLVVTTTSGDLVLHGDRTRWALRRPGGSAILRSSLFKIGVARGADGSPARVIATGAGNGHGIGLCQWGALGMARAGKSYREILRHYYEATALARL